MSTCGDEGQLQCAKSSFPPWIISFSICSWSKLGSVCSTEPHKTQFPPFNVSFRSPTPSLTVFSLPHCKYEQGHLKVPSCSESDRAQILNTPFTWQTVSVKFTATFRKMRLTLLMGSFLYIPIAQSSEINDWNIILLFLNSHQHVDRVVAFLCMCFWGQLKGEKLLANSFKKLYLKMKSQTKSLIKGCCCFSQNTPWLKSSPPLLHHYVLCACVTPLTCSQQLSSSCWHSQQCA